jgi:RimJ/RimL family protein N-acetyltransferase
LTVKQLVKTRRLNLVIVAGVQVMDLQSGTLPPMLRWGTGYSPDHLNLATQTVLDAKGVPAGIALLVLHSEVIGHIAFHAERSRADVVWISYEVSEHFQNQGYASEAVAALVKELLSIANVIRAEVLKGRAASMKVLERAGLTRTQQGAYGETWERTLTT